MVASDETSDPLALTDTDGSQGDVTQIGEKKKKRALLSKQLPNLCLASDNKLHILHASICGRIREMRT